MRDSVREAFPAFTARFEGVCAWLYLDVKGLVTTAIGNLADPVDLALGMPWVTRGGIPAGKPQVCAAWAKVKAATSMARLGGGAFAGLTDIRLTPDGVASVVSKRLEANEPFLRKYFPSYDSWCADAQLGLLSMSWALGASFAPMFFRFTAAANAGDWASCAGPDGCATTDPSKRGLSWMENNHLPGPNPNNPGLHPRNLANKILFQNASRLGARGANTLYYPQVL